MEALYFIPGAIFTFPIILFVVYVAYVHYLHRCYDHLPGPPRASFFLGYLPDITRNQGNIAYFTKNRQEYGPIYVVFFGHRPFVVLGDPEYIKEFFVSNQAVSKADYPAIGLPFGTKFFGPNSLAIVLERKKWQEKRQILNPAFHRKSLKNFMIDFNEVCDRFLAKIESLVGQNVRMSNEFSRTALEIIGQVSFNIKIGAIEDPKSLFLNAIASGLRYGQAFIAHPLRTVCPKLLSVYNYWPFQTELMKKQCEDIQFLRDYCRECILRRMDDIKRGKETPDDLLNTLIQHYSLEEIIDEFFTVFVAGHETTANTLAYSLYEILKNPNIEKKILEEVEEVLGDKENLDYQDLGKLRYVGQVMQESLRKLPVIAGMGHRIVEKDVNVGGYTLVKGTRVIAPFHQLNYNPKFWKNPEVFDPDRFSAPENIPNFNSLFTPFFAGPRNCIGQNFAKFEFKVLLTRVLRKFKFHLLPGQTDTIEQKIALCLRDGVMCKVELR